MESGELAAVKRASSTVAATWNQTKRRRFGIRWTWKSTSTMHPWTPMRYVKHRLWERERRRETWGEPKKTNGFFLEVEDTLSEEEEEEEYEARRVVVVALKQRKRLSVRQEFISSSTAALFGAFRFLSASSYLCATSVLLTCTVQGSYKGLNFLE